MSDSAQPAETVPDAPPDFNKAVRLMREEFGVLLSKEHFSIFRQIEERRFMVEFRRGQSQEGRVGAAYLATGEDGLLLAWNHPDALEVRLHGVIHAAVAVNLVDLLVDGLTQGYSQFIFDLGKISWVGNDVQGVLESLARSLRREGRPFRLEMRRAEGCPQLLRRLGPDWEGYAFDSSRQVEGAQS